MNKQYQFRACAAVRERVDALARKRGRRTADIMKIAIDIGLANLETERHIDLSRQIVLLELTATMVDVIAKKLVPESAEAVPAIVLRNLEKYHGKV